MRHSPPTSIHHPLNHHPQKKNAKCKCKCKMFLQSKQPCTRAVECSPSSCWWYLKQSNMEMILQRGWWGRGGKSKWLREKMTNDKKSSRLKILLFIMAGEHFKANDTNHQLERCRKRLRHRRQIQENCSIFLGSPGEKTFLHPQGKYLQVRGSCSAILATVPALRTAGPSLP